MPMEKYKIEEHNQPRLEEHRRRLDFILAGLKDAEGVLQKLVDFQVAIPSWALGTGGTGFGRFFGGGEPRRLEEKVEDVGLLPALYRSSGALSLHISLAISR